MPDIMVRKEVTSPDVKLESSVDSNGSREEVTVRNVDQGEKRVFSAHHTEQIQTSQGQNDIISEV